MKKTESNLPRGAEGKRVRVCPAPDFSYAQEEQEMRLYSELNPLRVMDLIEKLPEKRGHEVLAISHINAVLMSQVCKQLYGKTFQELRDEKRAARNREIGRTRAFVDAPLYAELRGARSGSRGASY